MTYRTDAIEDEIVSVGTSRVLRIRRIGTTFLVENMQQRRDDLNNLQEQWKVVCSVRPDGTKEKPGAVMSKTWLAAHKWLAESNAKVLEMIAKDMAARSAPRGQS